MALEPAGAAGQGPASGRGAVAHPDLAVTRSWARLGGACFERAATSLSPEDAALASLLPGWSRKEVVAHVACNAAALCNLLHWAATGEETPMYASADQRAEDIATWSCQPWGALLEQLRSAQARFEDGCAQLLPGQWAATIRTALGRTVPASVVPWLRAREVWVHAVDLGAGSGFAALPDDFGEALLAEVAESLSGREACPTLTLVAEGRHGAFQLGRGEPEGVVTGRWDDLLAWLTGRAGPAVLHRLAGSLAGRAALPVPPSWI